MKSRRLGKWSHIALTLAAMAFVIVCARHTTAEPLRVFAAASLKTALDDVVTEFAENNDAQVSVSYAGSSALARQIGLGAPADVFLSANSDWMDVLEKQGHIVSDSRRDMLLNRLVVIAPPKAKPLAGLTDLPERLGNGRLAMAQVDAVPAGIYGKAALEQAQIWATLSGQVAQTDNVRAALALVATGATPYGLVYLTDAIAEKRVSVVFDIPPTLHPTIVYPAAAINDTHHSRVFLDYLQSSNARRIFVSQGFIPVGAP